MRYTIYLLLFLMAVFSSCETVIEIDIPDQETKLTFNGFIGEGDTLNIFRLTKSKSVVEGSTTSFEPVMDGEIILYENEMAVETLHHEIIYQTGDYPSRFSYHSGNTYKISAAGAGLAPVTATTVCPGAVPPVITAFNPEAYTDDYGNKLGELKFIINDPELSENYYELQLTTVQSGMQNGLIYFNATDPALNIQQPFNIGGGFSGVAHTLFDDKLFNGESRSFTLVIASYMMNIEDGIVVKLSSTDRSFFLYTQSLMLQQQAEGNPFAEPAPVFNNIENGYGIWGAMVIGRDTIY